MPRKTDGVSFPLGRSSNESNELIVQGIPVKGSEGKEARGIGGIGINRKGAQNGSESPNLL